MKCWKEKQGTLNRDKGMGNRPNRSLPLTTQEEEILW